MEFKTSNYSSMIEECMSELSILQFKRTELENNYFLGDIESDLVKDLIWEEIILIRDEMREVRKIARKLLMLEELYGDC